MRARLTCGLVPPFAAHDAKGPLAMKRTYQPHNTRRARTHGFRARMATAGGRKVINNRRRKGRARLAPSIYKK
ncbi:uncharacterized protein SOCEGT47_022410 [Sorangium cellulosum]|uniref:Large ribosomal subunit protein bL34 n=2 Tax=Sorangium cellulosum TaxID=56 RepID=A0A4P2PY33_SORCE|nr:uncharacterized protein SOCEGT47_022410 [Sorangium cellulosum]